MLTARADRFFCVQDAAAYFSLVREALLAARRSIFIVGWDLLANVDLEAGRGDATRTGPSRLNDVIADVVRRRRELESFVLVWNYSRLYDLERDPFTRWRMTWRMPRRAHFRFDDRHPFAACHHQKIVVVDDALAFCGSIDLTSHRWDTSAHRLDQPERRTPISFGYGPYHEVQAMVSGPAAAALGQVARERWRVLGRRRLPPVDPGADLWPAGVTPDLTRADVTIARTAPEMPGQAAVGECESALVDAIARATRAIYIETQYFTSDVVAGALSRRLREPHPPDVIIVAPRECQGWLERQTMGALRGRLFAQLREADRSGRLRIVYPAASRSSDTPTFVHSKVTIVDDRIVRIGSANLSRRSMGMDTECDLYVHASTDEGRAGVRGVLHRLVGEHLGLGGAEAAAALARAGSLRALIDAHGGADRTLARIEPPPAIVEISDALRDAADPAGPFQDPRGGPARARRRPRPSAWTVPFDLAASAWSSLTMWMRGHRRAAGDSEFG